MNGALVPQFDILPEAQRALWSELKPALDLGFVLYGGTALALRLGHRQSLDFDFFTERSLSIDAIAKRFSFVAAAEVLQSDAQSYTLSVPIGSDYVKISFFGSLGFGRVGEGN